MFASLSLPSVLITLAKNNFCWLHPQRLQGLEIWSATIDCHRRRLTLSIGFTIQNMSHVHLPVFLLVLQNVGLMMSSFSTDPEWNYQKLQLPATLPKLLMFRPNSAFHFFSTEEHNFPRAVCWKTCRGEKSNSCFLESLAFCSSLCKAKSRTSPTFAFASSSVLPATAMSM